MIKKLLFKTSPDNSILSDLSLTTLRISAGLLMAGLHGLGKVPPSEKLIEGVTSLGFPEPYLFAWAAGLAELVGGIFLAAGFMTRMSAFFVGFTMFVAAFGRHLKDPWDVKELSVLYLAIALIFVFKGSGRFSIDHLIKA